jgi:hypothetical protein
MAAKTKKGKLDLKKVLRTHGSSQKDFAQWLGMTPEGLCIANKSGLSKALSCALHAYCAELRGISLKIDLEFFAK